MPMPFVLLANFYKQMLLPGESLSLYVHQLKQLLSQAMPDISDAAREQLVLHQFLLGLLQDVSKQLRATGAKTTLTVATQRARLLMTIEDQGETAAMSTKQPSANEFLQLQQQLSDLSKQVAPLSIHQPGKPRHVGRCFLCNKVDHLHYACPTQMHRRDIRRCFICNQPGHGWRNCQQGNGKGAAAWDSSRPRQQ